MIGLFVIAAGIADMPAIRRAASRQFGNNFAVPALFLHIFPSWFVGVAFAAIAIGALVPAAIMSIAVANLYTRNIHREFINRNPTDKQEAQMAKWVSLIVKFGALIFILFVPTQVRDPAAAARRHLDHPDAARGHAGRLYALVQRLGAARAAGRRAVAGTAMAVASKLADLPLTLGGYTFPGYSALYTVVLNLVIAVVLTPVFNAMSCGRRRRRHRRRGLSGVIGFHCQIWTAALARAQSFQIELIDAALSFAGA